MMPRAARCLMLLLRASERDADDMMSRLGDLLTDCRCLRR